VNACIIFVTLYVIGRSGESWQSFGITRPTILDVIIAIGLLVALDVLWHFVSRIPINDPVRPFLSPRTTGDHVWMWSRFLVGGFSEELVTRCYLITRLKTQLRSQTIAVVVAAVCFASYHIYQGFSGTIAAFAFGLMFGALYLLRPRIWPFALGHAFSNIAIELHAAG
jgi:membrane protease YdiL (CAAX protease family)